ncbi:hypothetical protein BVX97_00640, partial [bacterium E08(2017)]
TDTDWSGSDGAGLGARGASNTGGRGGGDSSTESFEGQIAIFRAYKNRILDSDQVMTNYNSVAGGSALIDNIPPSAISDSEAELRATMRFDDPDYDLTVFWGEVDGGTNPLDWAQSAFVISFTNVQYQAALWDYTATGLVPEQTYYYRFRLSNAGTNAWASPSWKFSTLPLMDVGPVTTNHLVPHSWLNSYDSSWTNDAEAEVMLDHDGDGYTTWQEYWCGTDPNNSNSFFKTDAVYRVGQQVCVEWQHDNPDGQLPPIAIYSCSNLISGVWQYAGEKNPTDGLNTWLSTPSQKLFYRLVVTNTP